MSKQVLHITGMTCDHCATSVQQALLSVGGVSGAEVSYVTGTAQIEATSDVPTSALLDAVRARGYGAEMTGGASPKTAVKLSIAIIGTGSGAFAAAIRAVEEGAAVTLI